MVPTRLQWMFQIFESAVELPPDQRSAFLVQACGQDEALRLKIQGLLEADRRAMEQDFLQQPLPRLPDPLQQPTRLESDTAALPAPPGPPPGPAQIGPYLLLEQLGRGGMGQVHRARHVDTGRMAAVKTVLVPHRAMLESLRREIRSLARLRHPGIVRILDEGLQDGLPWYAMELLEGTPLGGLWPEDSRPPLEQALQLVHGLCAPLSYLHGEGLVHRDLKPQNILLKAASREPAASSEREERNAAQSRLATRDSLLANSWPVLIDFGLLSAFSGEIHRDSLEMEDLGAGTPAYMAPEQIRGESCDARVDLYALGCILFELLTGRRVFEAMGQAEMLAAHLFHEPPVPSQLVEGLPPELDRLVLLLLAKDRRQRLGHADDLAAALERLGARPGPVAGPSARPYLYRPGFSGRARELERIGPALQRPSGQMLFVGGQSGIGKTRLALELAREATRRRFQVLAGGALPSQQGHGAALQPLRAPLQLLADRCRERGLPEAERLFGARAGVLAPYQPALGSLPGHEQHPAPPELPPKDARMRLFQALAEVLDAASLDEPLLLVLDDLQWADELTLGFLGSVLRAAAHPEWGFSPRGRWLLLGLYRTEEADEALRSLVSSPAALRFELGRLEPEAVSTMISDMLALPGPAELFSRFIDRHSEGNPFFVAEYLRVAVEEGLLWRDARGVWKVADLTGAGPVAETQDLVSLPRALPLPRSLLDLVQRRLAGLPEPALRLAELAAVVGREVDAGLLRRLAALEEAEQDAAVQELLRRQVLEEPQPGSLRFAHDKLHEGAYARIPGAQRPALHRKVAEALEGIPAADLHLAERGHHWEQAGEAGRALPCYLAAAQAANKGHAHGQAEQWYRAYLRLAAEPTRESLTAQAEMILHVLFVLGRISEAEVELGTMGSEARRIGDLYMEAESLRLMGQIHVRKGPAEAARPLYEQAIGICRRLGERRLEAVTLSDLGELLRDQGQIEEGLSVLQRSLALHREIGEVHSEATVLIALGGLHYIQGRKDEARAVLEQALARFRLLGDRRREAIALGNVALLDKEQGRPEVLQRYEEAIELHRQVGNRRSEAIGKANLSVELRDRGQLEEAWKHAGDALLLARQTESADLAGTMLGHLSDLELLMTGDTGRAEELAQEALRIMEQVGQPIGLGKVLCHRVAIALARGSGAREALESAEALGRRLQAPPTSELGQTLGELRRATEALERGEGHRLIRGRLPEDCAPGLQRWLLEHGAGK